jgi:glycosyltransferase involved in cell wall biosynthesis/MoaA/NifB/PqqE/SkfB family radical SAM enzyme
MRLNVIKKFFGRLTGSRMRVVFLVYEFDRDIAGGIGRVINGLSKELGKLIDLYIYHITFHNENSPDYYKSGTLYKLEDGAADKIYQNRFILTDVPLWEKFRFDIFQMYNYQEEIVEIVDYIKTHHPKSKFLLSCHYILKYETGTRKVYPKNLLYEEYLYRNMDHFHVLNKTSEKILHEYYSDIIKNKPVSIIPNGISEKEFEEKNPGFIDELMKKYDFKNKKIVLCLTRWCHGKGIEFLVDAIPAVLSQDENVLFIIAGKKENSWEKDGSDYVKLIEQKLENFSDNVITLGWLDDMKRNSLMSIADIWVFPSELEYFPYSVLEPMIKSIPIITSEFNGARDIISDKKECLMHSPRNSAELSGNIISLLNDNKMRKTLSENAYKRASREYQWPAIARSYKNLYKKCMRSKDRSGISFLNQESLLPVKEYDAIINWNLTMNCNFSCVYCNNKNEAHEGSGRFESTDKEKRLKNLKWEEDRIKYPDTRMTINPDFDFEKLASVLDRTGKTFKIRLLGGEPFVYPNFIDLCQTLTRKHYIDVESNFTSVLVKKFCDTVDPGRVQDIRVALHIEELEKNGLVGRFFENFEYCKTRGFNIIPIVVVYPGIINKIVNYRDCMLEDGIKLYMHPFVGYYNGKEYPASYTKKEIVSLNLDLELISFLRITKSQPCSAGKSSFVAFPSGDIFPCYQLDKKIGNLNSEIKPFDRIINCPFDKCSCDPKIMNKKLFDKTVNVHSG